MDHNIVDCLNSVKKNAYKIIQQQQKIVRGSQQ
jgi:hypothetical protein